MTLPVQFINLTQEEYDNLETKQEGRLYFTSDTHRIYKGNIQYSEIDGKEDKSNKVTEINQDSTDIQYPSAKSVRTFISTLLSNEEFKLYEEGEFKRMCISIARVLGATVIENNPLPDNPNGIEVALYHGLDPNDNTTYGDLMTKAGLQETDILNKLIDNN